VGGAARVRSNQRPEPSAASVSLTRPYAPFGSVANAAIEVTPPLATVAAVDAAQDGSTRGTRFGGGERP
jgi:hypothetical protein